MSKNSSRRKRQALKKKQEARLTGPVLSEQGLYAFNQRDYRQAIQAWEKARQKGETSAKLDEALAEAHFRQALSNPQPNLAELAQAVQLLPTDPVYRYHLALAQHRLGQLDQAEAIYRQLLAASPLYARAAIPLAQLLIEQKKPLAKDAVWNSLDLTAKAQLTAAEALIRGKAKSTLQRLTQVPLEPLWRGLVALARGDKADAEQNLRAALTDPRPLYPLAQGVVHYYLGVLAAEAGQLEVAANEWQAAQAGGFDTPHLWRNWSALAYRQAFAAYQAGQPAEALRWLKQISRKNIDPELDALARQVNFELGYAAAQQGRWEQALSYWQMVERTGDDSRALLLDMALAYQKTDHPFEAAERWRELLRRRPRKAGHPDALSDEQVARIWQNVAENYNQAGEYEEAVSTYKTALKWSPDSLELRLKLVEAQQAAGRWLAAENELNRILAQYPQHVPALVMLAEMYAEDYFPERARKLWRQVLVLEPQHPVARQQLAFLYEQEGLEAAHWGNPKRALEIYEAGLRELPDNQRLHLAMGRVYARQGNLDQARTCFERALALGPNDLSTLHDIFVVWLNQAAEADLQGVIDRIKAVTSSIPGDFFVDLIHHCVDSQQESFAKSLLTYAEGRYAEDSDTLIDLALLWVDLDQNERAATLLRRVLKTVPEHARANMNLGAVYYTLDQKRLAQRHWDKAQQQARKEGDQELLYELKVLKDTLVYGKAPPSSPFEILNSMPPQMRQQMLNQMPPEIAAMLENMGPDMLEAILSMGIPDDFDEENDDEYF